MITLDIFSDPICPWCFIGKSRLFQAMEARPDHPFDIQWHPFQLNPDMPAEGMDRRAYLEGKFGGKEAAVRAYAPIYETAQAMGLPMHLDKITRTPNTLDAHRLIHWAGQEGRQTPVVQFLFNAYFTNGLDISDHDVLVDVGVRAEMEPEMIRRLLSSDADRAEIQKRDAHARSRGVNSVPTFVIANQHVVPGAQPPEVWTQVIDDINTQLAAPDA